MLHFTLLYDTVLSYNYTACMSDSDCSSSTDEQSEGDDQFSSGGLPHSSLALQSANAVEKEEGRVVEVEMLDEQDRVTRRISVGPGERHGPAAEAEAAVSVKGENTTTPSVSTLRSWISRTPGLFTPFSSTKQITTTPENNSNTNANTNTTTTTTATATALPSEGGAALESVERSAAVVPVTPPLPPELGSGAVTQFIPSSAIDRDRHSGTTQDSSFASPPHLHFSHTSGDMSSRTVGRNAESPPPSMNISTGALVHLGPSPQKKVPSLRFTYRTASVASGLSIKQLKVLSERDNWEPTNMLEYYMGRVLFRGLSYQPLIKLENKTTWVIQPVTVTEFS